MDPKEPVAEEELVTEVEEKSTEQEQLGLLLRAGVIIVVPKNFKILVLLPIIFSLLLLVPAG